MMLHKKTAKKTKQKNPNPITPQRKKTNKQTKNTHQCEMSEFGEVAKLLSLSFYSNCNKN